MADIKTLDCGCEVIVATNGSVMLTYCPKHKAAPDLYEAVRWTLEDHKDGRAKLPVSTHTQLLKALTKAEGK